jgi:hypothetical protein
MGKLEKHQDSLNVIEYAEGEQRYAPLKSRQPSRANIQAPAKKSRWFNTPAFKRALMVAPLGFAGHERLGDMSKRIGKLARLMVEYAKQNGEAPHFDLRREL